MRRLAPLPMGFFMALLAITGGWKCVRGNESRVFKLRLAGKIRSLFPEWIVIFLFYPFAIPNIIKGSRCEKAHAKAGKDNHTNRQREPSTDFARLCLPLGHSQK